MEVSRRERLASGQPQVGWGFAWGIQEADIRAYRALVGLRRTPGTPGTPGKDERWRP